MKFLVPVDTLTLMVGLQDGHPACKNPVLITSRDFVSDIAIFVLKRDVKLQLTSRDSVLEELIAVCYSEGPLNLTLLALNLTLLTLTLSLIITFTSELWTFIKVDQYWRTQANLE